MCVTVLQNSDHSLLIGLDEITDIAPMLDWCIDNLSRDSWKHAVDKSDSPTLLLISIHSHGSIAQWKLTWL